MPEGFNFSSDFQLFEIIGIFISFFEYETRILTLRNFWKVFFLNCTQFSLSLFKILIGLTIKCYSEKIISTWSICGFMSIWTKFLERYLFKVDESIKFQVPQISVNKIPEEKTKLLRVDGFNPKNNNSLITNYYQLGLGSMHKYMLLEVGCQIMEEPVFDTLRTKEQLGYSVFSMLRNTHGIIGLSITVNTQVIWFFLRKKNKVKLDHD